MKYVRSILCGAMMSALGAVAAFAADPVQQHNSSAVWFENWIGLSNATMTVAAPNGRITTVFAAQGTPVFELAGENLQDGVYRYELSAATDEKIEIVNKIDNGRGDNQSDTMAKPFHSAGHFTVARGVIVTTEDIKEDDG